MSEKNDDLRKLVRAIVFLLAFAVTSVASIGILGIVMGIATGGVGLVMGGVSKSVGTVSEVVSLLPKIFERSAQEEMARRAEEERARQAEEAAKQNSDEAAEYARVAAEEAAKRAAEEAAELIMRELGGFALEEDSDAGTNAELKAAAEKWIKSGKAAANTSNFTFKAGVDGYYYWRATSKVKIGDCPAKSVWTLWKEGCEWGNDIPKKCESITPKVISDYKGETEC